MRSTDRPDLLWRKSSHSNGQANCVEVAAVGVVAVRDSKSPDGTRLTFAPDAWRQFIKRLAAGR
jgi:hypothetical protein